MRGHRAIAGGRADVRKVLYMAVTAIRHNPPIRDLYIRLSARARPPVATTRILANLTPADIYFGRGKAILAERASIKKLTIRNRRLSHHGRAT